MFIAETKLRVRYAETDQMGVVYHGNYFEFFEVARVEAIRQIGFNYADMEKDGLVMPVVEVHARYLRPALYDELLTIKTILKEMPLNYKIEFHHEIRNEKDELLTTGRVILFFMELKTKKRQVIPENLSQKLQTYFS